MNEDLINELLFEIKEHEGTVLHQRFLSLIREAEMAALRQMQIEDDHDSLLRAQGVSRAFGNLYDDLTRPLPDPDQYGA